LLLLSSSSAIAAAGDMQCVRDSQLDRDGIIRLSTSESTTSGRKLLRGVIAINGLCAELEGTSEPMAGGETFIGVRAKLAGGKQEIAYHMVGDQSFHARGTVSTTEPRGVYQTRAVWTPIRCEPSPPCSGAN
jgi:hypothetical protein